MDRRRVGDVRDVSRYCAGTEFGVDGERSDFDGDRGSGHEDFGGCAPDEGTRAFGIDGEGNEFDLGGGGGPEDFGEARDTGFGIPSRETSRALLGATSRGGRGSCGEGETRISSRVA